MAIKKDLILDLAKNLETSDEENSIIIKFDDYNEISYIDKLLSKSSAYYYYMNDKGKIVDVDKASILFISKAEDILESELDETEAGDIAPVEVPLFKNKVFKRNIFEDSEDDSDYESEDLDPDFEDSEELEDLDFDFDDYIDSERNVTRTNNEISNSLKDLDLVQRVSADSPFGDSEKTFQELNITDNTDYGNTEEIDFDKLVNRDLDYVEPEEISKKFDFIQDDSESQEEDPESFFITDDDIAVLDARDIGFEELNSFLDSLDPEDSDGNPEDEENPEGEEEIENPSANDMEPPIKTRDEEDSLFDDKNSNDELEFGSDDTGVDQGNPFDDGDSENPEDPEEENPEDSEDDEENVNDSYDPEIAKKYTESIDVENLRTKQRNKNRASYEQKHAKNSEESLEKDFNNSKKRFKYKSSSNKEKYQKEYERLN